MLVSPSSACTVLSSSRSLSSPACRNKHHFFALALPVIRSREGIFSSSTDDQLIATDDNFFLVLAICQTKAEDAKAFNAPVAQMKRQNSQLRADLPFDPVTLTFRCDTTVRCCCFSRYLYGLYLVQTSISVGTYVVSIFCILSDIYGIRNTEEA